jgi:hypothetical protein
MRNIFFQPFNAFSLVCRETYFAQKRKGHKRIGRHAGQAMSLAMLLNKFDANQQLFLHAEEQKSVTPPMGMRKPHVQYMIHVGLDSLSL